MSSPTLFTKHLLAAYMAWSEENTGRAHLVIPEANVRLDFLKKYVRDGRLILNVGSSAIRDLFMDEDDMRFTCRFDGQARGVHLNYEDIIGVASPIDGSILPINVLPILTTQGPGLMLIAPLEEEQSVTGEAPAAVNEAKVEEVPKPDHVQSLESSSQNVFDLAARRNKDK